MIQGALYNEMSVVSVEKLSAWLSICPFSDILKRLPNREVPTLMSTHVYYGRHGAVENG